VFRGLRFEENDVSLSIACGGSVGKRRPDEWEVGTKCDISIPHPRGNADLVIRCKSGHFVAGEQVPHDCCTPRIVAHDQAASSALADGVGSNPRNVLAMPGKPSLYGQSVVVEAEDDVALGIEQEGGGCSAWFEGKFVAARRDAGGWRLKVDVGAHRGASRRGALSGKPGGHCAQLAHCRRLTTTSQWKWRAELWRITRGIVID